MGRRFKAESWEQDKPFDQARASRIFGQGFTERLIEENDLTPQQVQQLQAEEEEPKPAGGDRTNGAANNLNGSKFSPFKVDPITGGMRIEDQNFQLTGAPRWNNGANSTKPFVTEISEGASPLQLERSEQRNPNPEQQNRQKRKFAALRDNRQEGRALLRKVYENQPDQPNISATETPVEEMKTETAMPITLDSMGGIPQGDDPTSRATREYIEEQVEKEGSFSDWWEEFLQGYRENQERARELAEIYPGIGAFNEGEWLQRETETAMPITLDSMGGIPQGDDPTSRATREYIEEQVEKGLALADEWEEFLQGYRENQERARELAEIYPGIGAFNEGNQPENQEPQPYQPMNISPMERIPDEMWPDMETPEVMRGLAEYEVEGRERQEKFLNAIGETYTNITSGLPKGVKNCVDKIFYLGGKFSDGLVLDLAESCLFAPQLRWFQKDLEKTQQYLAENPDDEYYQERKVYLERKIDNLCNNVISEIRDGVDEVGAELSALDHIEGYGMQAVGTVIKTLFLIKVGNKIGKELLGKEKGLGELFALSVNSHEERLSAYMDAVREGDDFENANIKGNLAMIKEGAIGEVVGHMTGVYGLGTEASEMVGNVVSTIIDLIEEWANDEEKAQEEEEKTQ